MRYIFFFDKLIRDILWELEATNLYKYVFFFLEVLTVQIRCENVLF